MGYDLEFLKKFSGDIAVEDIDMSCLINALEKNVSQYLYEYELSGSYSDMMKIEVSNSHIPHLLGLSKQHHFGLPTYYAASVFEGLKNDWTLQSLKAADEGWFNENRYKIIGVLFLYQMLHLHKSQAYTVEFVKSDKLKTRLNRDNICFVIFKVNNHISYTLELSPHDTRENVYIPRSMRINDGNIKDYSPINVVFKNRTRIKSPKKIPKVKWENH